LTGLYANDGFNVKGIQLDVIRENPAFHPAFIKNVPKVKWNSEVPWKLRSAQVVIFGGVSTAVIRLFLINACFQKDQKSRASTARLSRINWQLSKRLSM
jgi:hypothetical protein